MDAFAWDSEAEDEWDDDGTDAGSLFYTTGLSLTNFIFPSLLLLLILLLSAAVCGEKHNFTDPSSTQSIVGTTTSVFIANFFGPLASVVRVLASPITSLVARDEALRELSQNYWTGVFEPALPSYLSHQRKLPILLGGGLAVAALQFMGCPLYATALTMLGLAATGRSFLDLFAMGNVASLATPHSGGGPAGMMSYLPSPAYF